MENKWYGISIPKDNELYQTLEALKEQSDSIFEIINAALGLVQGALVFVQSLLSLIELPIVLALRALLEEIKKLRDDLANIGVYLTYDRNISEAMAKPHLLQGGFEGFERRMIEALTNEKDTTRPIFSNSAEVVALMVHAGGGIISIVNIINKVLSFLRLFTEGDFKSPPSPAGVNVQYYKKFLGVNTELPLSSVTIKDVPEGIRVKWALSRPANPNALFPSIVIPPPGYLLVVSTRPVPLYLHASFVPANGTATGRITRPVLYNGKRVSTDMVRFMDLTLLAAKFHLETGFIEGKTKLFFDSGKETGDSITIAQALSECRLFSYDTNIAGTLFAGGFYELDISKEELPQIYHEKGEPVSGNDIPKYYVVVHSAPESDAIESDDLPKLDGLNHFPIYTVKDDTYGQYIVSPTLDGVGDISAASTRVSIQTPSSVSAEYLTAIKNALGVFLLCRGDLPDLSEEPTKKGDGTGSGKAKKAVGNTAFYDPIPNPFSPELRTKILDLLGLDGPLDDSIFRLNALEFKLELKRLIDGAIYRMIKSGTLSGGRIQGLSEQINVLNKGGLNGTAYALISSGEGLSELELSATTNNENYGPLQPSALKVGVDTLSDLDRLRVPIVNTFSDKTYGSDYLSNDLAVPLINADKHPVIFTFVPGSLSTRDERTQQGVITEDTGTNTGFYKDTLQGLLSVMTYPGPQTGREYFLDSGLYESVRLLGAAPVPPVPRGVWIFKKLFENGIPGVDTFLNTLIDFIQNTLNSLNSIVEQVRQYINLLSQRISEIQRIIVLLKSVIDAFLNFRLPLGLDAYFVRAQGTTDLVSKIESAENKPDIPSYEFSTGAIAVMGGLPSIVIELLQSFIDIEVPQTNVGAGDIRG